MTALVSLPADMSAGWSPSRFVGNQELDTHALEQRQGEPVVRGLSAYINTRWERAKQAKQDMQYELLRCLRQRNGFYEPDKLAAIREVGGSEIYMQLSDVKCRSAASWLRDVLLPGGGDLAWSVSATPIADLPAEMELEARMKVTQEVLQEFAQSNQEPNKEAVLRRLEEVREELIDSQQEVAEKVAKRMGKKMEDQLVEGGWEDAFYEFLDDLVTYPVAYLKGPVVRKRKKIRWAELDAAGTVSSIPVVVDVLMLEWQRCSPFDMYHSPGAKTCQDGYLFHRQSLPLTELEAMKGVPGYDEEAINQVILEHGRGGLREWLTHDTERAALEGRPTEFSGDMDNIDALNFWGVAPGFILIEWGVEDIDISQVYHIEAWKIGRWVIKAVVNPDPLGQTPYSHASYVRVPGSLKGKGVCQLVRDDQDMCNGAARAMSNNMGIASGPQVAINDISRLPDGEDITGVEPWKIWQFGPDQTSTSGSRKPIEFFQPESLVTELLEIFDKFSRAADEHAALPAYIYGGTERVEGAGTTASGLAMLMGQASKSMKLVVTNIDLGIIKPRVTALYNHNMLHDPDQTIKGDCMVRALGSSALLIREQRQIRLNEFMQTTANPIDMAIMGPKGRAALLREHGKDLVDMDIDEIIPDAKELQFQSQGDPVKMAKMQADEQKSLADQRKAGVDTEKAKNDGQQLQIEARKAEDNFKLKMRELDIKEKELELKGKELDQKMRDSALNRAADGSTSDKDRDAKLAESNAGMVGDLTEVEGELQTVEDQKAAEKKATEEKKAETTRKAKETKQGGDRHTEVLQTITLMNETMAAMQKQHGVDNQTIQAGIDLLGNDLQEVKEGQDVAQRDKSLIAAHLKKTGKPETKNLVNKLEGV